MWLTMPLSLIVVSALAPGNTPVQNPATHDFDLIHVDYRVRLDFKNEAISGVVNNRLELTKDGGTVLFHKGPMRIESVEVSDDRGTPMAVRANITDTTISIPFRGQNRGTKLNVAIRYYAQPEAGIYFVDGKRAHPGKSSLAYTQGEMEDTRYWLPTYDYPDDKATVYGQITVPDGMNVLSNGAQVGKTTQNGETTYAWKIDRPIVTYLISVVAGDYINIPDGNFKRKPVQIWAPRGTEEMAKAAFGGTDKIVAFFSQITGFDYPFEKYAQSTVPEFMFGGMENASCTTQTIGAIFPKNSASVSSATGLNAHELAHQWFGDTVTTPSWPHIWINEGWATFLPHFWFRKVDGEDAFHIQRYGTYQGAGYAVEQNPMIRTNYEVAMDLFDGNAYSGGATRMFMLMNQVGEKKFWAACKSYLNTYAFNNVNTEQFFEHWGKTLGTDLNQFRRQWYYIKGKPKFKVRQVSGGFEISQSVRGYDLSPEILLLNPDGKPAPTQKINLKSGESAMISANPGTVLVVDPGAWLLCDIEYLTQYAPDKWEALYKVMPNAAGKLRVVEHLAQNLPAMDRLFRWERSLPVKRVLAGSLTSESRILEFLRGSDDKLRQTGIYMANGSKSSAVSTEISRIFEKTTNEALKNAAFSTLLSIKDDDATAQLGWNTTTYNLQTQSAALSWWASKNPDKARALALNAVKNYAPGPIRIIGINVLGMVKDEPGKREVFDLLSELVKGRAYTPMSSAIGALATYGDRAAIPIIESRRNHSLHFGRGTVRSALARLRQN
jgi:aminopeptidase N